MRIRISDPRLVSELLDFLRRSNCTAVQTSSDMLAVSIPEPLPYEVARMELDLYLAEWHARHSDARAVLID